MSILILQASDYQFKLARGIFHLMNGVEFGFKRGVGVAS